MKIRNIKWDIDIDDVLETIDEMTVEEWAQNVEDAFAQVRADMEAAN